MRLILYAALILFTFSVKSQQEGIWMHPNEGQWDKEILYKIELSIGEMYLTKEGFTYALNNFNEKKSHQNHSKETNENDKINFQIIKSTFIGSSWKGEKTVSKPSSFYRNYFKGNDPSKWKSNVYSYQTVELKDFYPKIDLLVEGTNENLKYSFKISPQIDPSVIQYKIDGADGYSIAENGDLHVKNRFGEIVEQKPIAWNIINGEKKNVKVKFKLTKGIVSFYFPNSYNKNYPLIIDPVLTFSTFSGSTMDNWGMTATPDLKGNLYAGGIVFTGSGSYPTTIGAFDITYNGGTNYLFISKNDTFMFPGFDIAISKFNSTGTGLIYSTYFGGSENEAPHSLVVDNNGDLFVFGVSSSSDFPTTPNAFDVSFNSGPSIVENELGYTSGTDIIVAHFNSAGTALIGSTFVGGSGTDGVNIGVLNYNYGDPFRGEIIVDNAGFVYVSSTSRSTNFPTTSGLQTSLKGEQDAVILKLNSNLTSMIWSTYFGGSDFETGNSLQLSSNGKLYIAGGTSSTDLPISIGENLTYNGGISDGYILKLNCVNGSTVSGSYMGMDEYDQAYFVQLDLNNDVYIYGQTESDWPITSGLYGTPNSGQFIRKYNSNLTSISWTTMIGAGTGHVEISPTAFLVSDCFDIYITGWGGKVNISNSNQAFHSTTNGFQVTPDAFQATTNGSNFYIALLGSNASTLKYATFMGGTNSSFNHVDGGTSRFDKNGKIYHAVCASCDLPTTGFTTTPGAFSETDNGPNCNLAAFKFELNSILPLVNAPQTTVCINIPVVFKNNSQNSNAYLWEFGDGTTSTVTNPSHTYNSAGIYNAKLIASDTAGCFTADSVTFTVKIGDFQGGAIQPTTPICKGTAYQLEAYGGTKYSWTPSAVLDDPTSPTPFATIDQTTDFTVLITDSCGVDTITITLQVLSTYPTVTNDTSICIGNSVQIGVFGAASQNWSPVTTLSNTSSSSPIATPQNTTLYYVQGTTIDKCNYIDSVLVTVFFDLPTPLIPDTVKFCIEDTIMVIVGGAETYLWSPNSFINTIIGDSVLISTNTDQYYFCDFTNSCGTKTDSVYIKIDTPKITTSRDTTICPGTAANLWADGGELYSWKPLGTIINPTSETTKVYPTKNTLYYVIGTDHFGCTDTAFVQVNLFPSILLQVCSDVYAFNGDIIKLTANSNVNGNYVWSPNNYLSCENCQITNANPNQNATYTVSFTDQNGCSKTDDVSIYYDELLYVPNTFTPDDNSFNNVFKAIGGNITEFEMLIFDRWGGLIFTSNSLDNAWDGTNKNLECPIGTYTWKITYSDNNNYKKELVGHINIVK
jgi:gliding motility-associated-like protein